MSLPSLAHQASTHVFSVDNALVTLNSRTHRLNESLPALLLVTTTCDDPEVLRRIAHDLVVDRLAACAQLTGPAESTYVWQSKLEQAKEWVLTLKTTGLLWSRVKQAIQERHSYDVPEIIGTPITAVARAMPGGCAGNWIPPTHEDMARFSPSGNIAATSTGETGLDQRLEVPGPQPNKYRRANEGDV